MTVYDYYTSNPNGVLIFQGRKTGEAPSCPGVELPWENIQTAEDGFLINRILVKDTDLPPGLLCCADGNPEDAVVLCMTA